MSGFYWHFKDRAELLNELLQFWAHEYTEVVSENAQLRTLAPEERLLATANMILEHNLTRYDIPFRAWAQTDPAVLAKLQDVYRKRLAWLRGIFKELGFVGDELEMRVRLFTCYFTWQRIMFPDQSKARAKRLIKRQVALLVRP